MGLCIRRWGRARGDAIIGLEVDARVCVWERRETGVWMLSGERDERWRAFNGLLMISGVNMISEGLV